MQSLFRKKSIETTTPHLHRSLTRIDLILMGIGAIIGAGVFVLTGVAAATKAGPAIILSYALAGFAAMLAALAYAELTSCLGGAGSVYHYTYIGLGEFIAWIIGWDLLLEYSMAVSTVSIGWAGYVNNLLQTLHIYMPESLTKGPFEGGIVNLLAVMIIVALAILLGIGVKQSARFNAAIVFIKLFTIVIFILFAAVNVDIKNWGNFLAFGWSGVIEGAALVFFAYIGFDALSTAVEESIHPQRDLPIAIMVSLGVCTAIYILVSALLTGIVPYTTLNVPSPVANALLQLNHRFAAGLIAAGAIAGLTTVILIMFYGLTRICMAIARDGLLPIKTATIHPKTLTPITIIIITGVINAIVAGLAPIQNAAELVNIGTLAAFTLVCIGVIVFRSTHPDLHRPFQLPYNPIIPLLGVIVCLYLMISLPAVTWFRFLLWMGLGLIIYFIYSRHHSLLNKTEIK